MLPWMSWLAALGVAPAVAYLIAQKQEKKDVELYDLRRAVSVEIGSISGVVLGIPRLSKKSRVAIFAKLNAVSQQINAHFETHAKAVYEARVEAARRAGEDRDNLRRSSQNAGIETAIEMLRQHEASIDAHLGAQRASEAERATLRLFVVGAETLMRARLTESK